MAADLASDEGSSTMPRRGVYRSRLAGLIEDRINPSSLPPPLEILNDRLSNSRANLSAFFDRLIIERTRFSFYTPVAVRESVLGT